MDKNLARARNKVYRLFLQGNIGERGNARERAEMSALVGDFPRALEFIKTIKETSVRKKLLYRMISALRRSFELPHETKAVKRLGDLDLLLWREYFDAARMWASFEDKYCRWRYYLQIYEKTSWPQDVEEARKSAHNKREFGAVKAWLAIAKATRRLEDITELDHCLENVRWAEKNTNAEMAIFLADRHELDGTGDHLGRAIAIADKLGKPSPYPNPGPIEIWQAICRASDTRQNRAKLRKAEQELTRLKRQWAREEEKEERRIRLREKLKDKKKTDKPDLQSPSHCLYVAKKKKSLWYLNRTLRLLETYSDPDRTRLLLETLDLIDRWKGKEVLERRYYTPPEQSPPSIPDILRGKTDWGG